MTSKCSSRLLATKPIQGKESANMEINELIPENVVPSPANVKAACEEFDREEATVEAALRELFTAYPKNTTKHHVLLKVTALNFLYSTFIRLYNRTRPDVSDMAEYISRNGDAIDWALAGGLAEIVDQIAQP